MSQNVAQKVYDDLLSIEVNVIVKPTMTARKMPEPPHALLDIIGDYEMYLTKCARSLATAWSGAPPPISVRSPYADDFEPPPAWRTNRDGLLTLALVADSVPNVVSVETFDQLRERAVETECVLREVDASDTGLDESDIVVLKRVYRNCDQIKEILKREPIAKAISSSKPIDRDASRTVTLPLTSDELLTVRKVWELGVEKVEMQTVAQLDGDIVTRIRRARLASTSATLHSLHREAVESALGHWQSLFQTVVQFATTLIGGVFSRRT